MRKKTAPSQEELLHENQGLKDKLEELEETFRAIRHDEVDALIINTPKGDRVFTLRGADQSYRILIEQMKEGAAMLSKNVQTILYANNSLANMLKLPLEKVTGRSIREHIAPTCIEAFNELLKECRNGTDKISKEISLQRSDGTTIPTIMSLSTVTIDGAEATYTVVTDLTEHMADEVKRYTQKLETEIKQKTEALRIAERMAAIGETAGMVGHDIRNPLQTIVGELFLAKDELKHMKNDAQKRQMTEMLGTIDEQITYINKIVTDLQDYAKPLRAEPRQTNINNLIKETLRDFQFPETIQVIVKIDRDLSDLFIDPLMGKRMLANLISNALQAIPEKGKITIETKYKSHNAIITVTDTGVGIPDEIKPKMFQPLFTTKAKGQGFGLAVVKRIVEAHKGNITFESQEGKGTSFTITLPQQKSQNQA